jgi:hypothetical protein
MTRMKKDKQDNYLPIDADFITFHLPYSSDPFYSILSIVSILDILSIL